MVSTFFIHSLDKRKIACMIDDPILMVNSYSTKKTDVLLHLIHTSSQSILELLFYDYIYPYLNFEVFTQKNEDEEISEKRLLTRHITCAVLSGCLATCITHPLELWKLRSYQSRGRKISWYPLYTGLPISLIRYIPNVIFSVYSLHVVQRIPFIQKRMMRRQTRSEWMSLLLIGTRLLADYVTYGIEVKKTQIMSNRSNTIEDYSAGSFYHVIAVLLSTPIHLTIHLNLSKLFN
jgi:hypothetical protein